MQNQRIIFIHPCFKVRGGAEKVVIDMFNWTSKKFRTRLYTLFHDKKLDNISNKYAVAKDLPLSKYVGYKINLFNIPLIKKLGKKIAKECSEKDTFLISNFPASIIFYEATRHKPKLKKANTIFLSFEPDRILYYKEQKKFNYIPQDIINWKLSFASMFIQSWKKMDTNVIKKRVNKTVTLSDYNSQKVKEIYHIKNVKNELFDYIEANKLKTIQKKEAVAKINKHFNLNINPKEKIILSLSRLEPSKGLLELHNIVKQLNKAGHKFQLLIGGTGALLNKFKKMSENDDFLEVLGFVPDELLTSFYCAGDIFIFLGTKEPSGPLTILEAMYCNNIVIAANDGGPKEVINHGINGFLVNPHDKLAIKNLILKITHMDNKQFAKIKKQGRKDVLTKYEFKIFCKKLLKILSN